jgi:hypothetical protein
MSQRIPTRPGDILILQTTSLTPFMRSDALAVRNRRIFRQNIDTGEWSEIPN